MTYLESRQPIEQPCLSEAVIVRDTLGDGSKLVSEPGIHNGFLGISLGRTISDRHLKMYIEWAMQHCRHCPVVIDDIEFRHNYITFDGLNEEQATNRSLARGKEIARRAAGIIADITFPFKETSYIKAHPDEHVGHGFWVKRTSEIIGNGQIQDILEKVTQGYKKDGEFKRDIDAQVDIAMGKRLALQKTQVTESEYQAGLTQLSRFVLEEIAVTLGLVESGYSIEVYAGKPIQAVVNLYGPENKYPKLREALYLEAQYGHVNLGIEKQKGLPQSMSKPVDGI